MWVTSFGFTSVCPPPPHSSSPSTQLHLTSLHLCLVSIPLPRAVSTLILRPNNSPPISLSCIPLFLLPSHALYSLPLPHPEPPHQYQKSATSHIVSFMRNTKERGSCGTDGGSHAGSSSCQQHQAAGVWRTESCRVTLRKSTAVTEHTHTASHAVTRRVLVSLDRNGALGILTSLLFLALLDPQRIRRNASQE